MNIGIVTTWFERGAAYVSRQFEQTLSARHFVFIYARGGESQARDDSNWNNKNVHWGKKIYSPFLTTAIDKKDFIRWIKANNIDTVLFNEQIWWMPLLWCKDLGVKTVCYVDYYKKETLPLFINYDLLICNTLRHLSAFDFISDKTIYIPWGTDTDLYCPKPGGQKKSIVFFHSCGMDPYRKGTDMVLKAFKAVNAPAKLVIHTQVSITAIFPELNELIKRLETEEKLEIIQKSVHAPGLFHLGDVYVYPSRLEGVGLTIAEALSSGLACIVPDNGPMNEFVTEECGALIKLTRQYSRQDAYYWPECESSIPHLTTLMQDMALHPKKVEKMKAAARNHAVSNLNWKINSFKILDAFEILRMNPLSKEEDRASIIAFENKGKRKVINKLLPYHSLMKLFKKFLPA
jgi:1,2-diacylglycerol 3-alpha-glucosyltransferase